MTETVSKDTVQEGRQCDRIDQRDRRKENGWGHAQDIARERQQSPPQKRTRPPPRRSEGWKEWATPTGPPTEELARERWQTPEGEGPSREGRTLADSQPHGGPQQAHRQPQGAKRIVRQRPKPHPKEKAASPKQPADRRQSREGGPGSRPTARGAQWREPRTSHDPQLQWGPSGKRAPAAAGRKPSHQPRYKTPAGRRRAGRPRQPQTRSKGRGGNPEPQHGTGKNTGGS